jgi:transcriptional regulator of heat shock response
LHQFSGEDAHFLGVILGAIRQQLVQHSVWEDRLIRNVKQCLSLPDYADKADVQQLLDVLDDQPFMDALMMPNVPFPTFDLKIGTELNDPRLMQSSFVSIPISMDDVGIAQLGILGPRRMDYQRIQQLFSCDKTLAELIQV